MEGLPQESGCPFGFQPDHPPKRGWFPGKKTPPTIGAPAQNKTTGGAMRLGYGSTFSITTGFGFVSISQTKPLWGDQRLLGQAILVCLAQGKTVEWDKLISPDWFSFLSISQGKPFWGDGFLTRPGRRWCPVSGAWWITMTRTPQPIRRPGRWRQVSRTRGETGGGLGTSIGRWCSTEEQKGTLKTKTETGMAHMGRTMSGLKVTCPYGRINISELAVVQHQSLISL